LICSGVVIEGFKWWSRTSLHQRKTSTLEGLKVRPVERWSVKALMSKGLISKDLISKALISKALISKALTSNQPRSLGEHLLLVKMLNWSSLDLLEVWRSTALTSEDLSPHQIRYARGVSCGLYAPPQRQQIIKTTNEIVGRFSEQVALFTGSEEFDDGVCLGGEALKDWATGRARIPFTIGFH
jgi:hypothetical protein